MLGLIVPILLAIAFALLAGGSFAAWTGQRFRWWQLAAASLVVQLVLYSPPFNSWPALVTAGPAVGLVSMGVVVLMLLANASGTARVACGLAALGVVLNLVVMLANG